ncbi:MAG: GNAT family N-acetyltransferase [Candidatus Gracilibacteria bacterium]|nr:GNAT family N-acetyltransferase [Candidatus Gracilibacteria bacterium]
MKIEVPSPDDAAEIFFVQRQTWHESYTRYLTHEEIEHRFTDAPERIEQIREGIKVQEIAQYFVARDAGKIVGFISLAREPKNEIRSLYVLEQCQGQGVGRKLLQKAFDWFAGEPIFVHTDEQNAEAQAFYKKFGFEFVQRLPSSEREGFTLLEFQKPLAAA